MSDTVDLTTSSGSKRLDEFQAEVASLKVTGGGANPERTGMVVGIVLFALGALLAVIGFFGRGSTDASETQDLLQEIVKANNAMVLVGFGMVLALVGIALYLRNSLTRYFRYWLVRLIYEDRESTDRLIAALERKG
ncbi:MAG: hypothetical protein KDB21_16475 [Acidimicrobiales bacterium]|nr:hypothetical protein [Acidimicrobiales bacterium]